MITVWLVLSATSNEILLQLAKCATLDIITQQGSNLDSIWYKDLNNWMFTSHEEVKSKDRMSVS